MGASGLRDAMTSLPAREPQRRRPERGRRGGTAAPGPLAPVLGLQRMAGNRAVATLIARDAKTKPPPAKTPAAKPLPKQTYVAISGIDPIPVESAQFGTTQRTRSDRESPKPVFTPSEVTVTSFLGDHSTAVFQMSLRGDPFSAEVVFVKSDGQPYMKIKLTNALITAYSVSGHGGGPDSKPMESWVLNAEKIEVEQLGGGGAANP
jgi:hypothetical protein